ncbi:hypothetical protein PVIIG_00175 [Plasmodium vivax India VII]|uniref:Uncharacterized protein n=4 Tax=Plasmodium vivax TaxID=5855 RepID=A5K3H8_PLAVS|nr:hypothetical protein, conserved [Plasmodium vivax]KMZ78780.1 hypothetical protein PVIIG_00175 [Plasmodium vivax India VII]KMZ85166.1 hypothetical protein PVBG_01565 [Plasmodium vivax Brazil I]EDL46082.1 hypothetical protein, conserved [Plasmodium vivax]CAI7722306.1 conserved Plasmodium protein, unknown function [Plasmodium vivax]SCO68871.1 conserved Plasmodium protein, unknown function [Plasmodium vivax]|eukprot:XP_001615809.1 hypothetical protein [Plasmodium vivax Sal-1]
MIQQKKKKTKPPINLATLEDKINILNFMKDDFEKILDKENEIHGIVTKQHNTKEEKTLNEKEKIDIILSELLLSCEEKKNQLNKYIKTANEIISQNNDIIQKEKEEIENLILGKNQEINSLQQKIDLAKCFYDDVNDAMVKLFNNLDLFLKNKMNVELTIDHLGKISKGEENMGNKPRGENTQHSDEHVRGYKRENEGEDPFLQQLYHSMDEYEKKVCIIKSFMRENELDHLSEMLLTEKGSDAGLPAQLPHIPQMEEKNMKGQGNSRSGDPHSRKDKQVRYEDTCVSKTGQSGMEDDTGDETVSGEGEMDEEESEDADDGEDLDDDEDGEESLDGDSDGEESLDDDSGAEEESEEYENDDEEEEVEEEDEGEEEDEDGEEEEVEEDDDEGGSLTDDASAESTQRKKFNSPAESADNFGESLEATPNGHTEKTCGKKKILNDAETTIKSFSSEMYKKILSDNMNVLMDKINKIDYDYVSYFEKKLKS